MDNVLRSLSNQIFALVAEGTSMDFLSARVLSRSVSVCVASFVRETKFKRKFLSASILLFFQLSKEVVYTPPTISLFSRTVSGSFSTDDAVSLMR